ncbi:MAG: DUF1552 domain-containing protein [Myxococcales bacterium]|nr:DUF1552 domain-containing protein [Myxococcales bacterium]
MSRRPNLRRRAFLTGLGGAVVGLPFLEALSTRPAAAQAQGPIKRLIIVYTSNGTVLRDWLPTTTGQGFDVPPILQAFDTPTLRPKLSVLSGIQMASAKIGSANGHATGMTSLLTGRNFGETVSTEFGTVGWGAGISIDQAIAREVAAQNQLESIQAGVQTQRQYGNFYSYMCYGEGGGSANAIVSEDDPKKVFQRLFGNIPSSGESEAALQKVVDQRHSVIDLVKDDFASLQSKVSVDDRAKLDKHLALIRELEDRIVVGPYCARPDEPTIADGDIQKNAQFPGIAVNQMDLIATALACDITRVATLQFSTAQSGVNYKALLPNTESWDQPADSTHHGLSHDSVPTNQIGGATAIQQAAVDKIAAINTWFASQIAYLADKLASFDDGDGKTVLDNTAILWVSEISEGPNHRFDDMPYVLIGDMGGALKTGHFAFGNDETHNNLFVTLGKAMGIQGFDTFGDPQFCDGAIETLLV